MMFPWARSSHILLVALAVTPCASADQPDRIEWNASRQLAWENFAAPVPRSEEAKRIAATTASIPWSYEFSIRRHAGSCHYTITAIESAAYFHVDASWAHPDHRNGAVLRHEHGHFDIAHIYSRQFHTATRGLIGYEGECRGRSNRKASRYSELAITELLGSIYDEVWAEYRSHQQAYDRETRHGSDPDSQSRWTERIAVMLTAGPEHGRN